MDEEFDDYGRPLKAKKKAKKTSTKVEELAAQEAVVEISVPVVKEKVIAVPAPTTDVAKVSKKSSKKACSCSKIAAVSEEIDLVSLGYGVMLENGHVPSQRACKAYREKYVALRDVGKDARSELKAGINYNFVKPKPDRLLQHQRVPYFASLPDFSWVNK